MDSIILIEKLEKVSAVAAADSYSYSYSYSYLVVDFHQQIEVRCGKGNVVSTYLM